jgi:serine/threonine protein kinase
MIGKTLGHYRVGEQLGRGGMGDVYLAEDLNLNRKVALKFLPDAFAADPERMARFEREPKLLASLNHPNIAAIYGLEQAEGKRFLVLELVEGETLAQRLSKGALSVEDALGICRQIADALEAAHEKGVIHRDLKPANVMITEGDKVKVLDFGLAKALSDETQSVDSSQSPTLTEAMTRPGVILGTAAYMSPEQAKGKAVDKRADLWAFGCILYECLTGKRAFEGETVTETLASVLKNEPHWQVLPATTPPNIRFVLRRCLERDMNKRFHHAADMRILLEEGISFPLTPGMPEAGAASRPRLTRILSLAVSCLILGSVVTGAVIWRLKPASEPELVSRVSITLPPDHRLLQRMDTPILGLSPDGKKLAYLSSSGSAQQICLRRMDSFEATSIAGTEGGFNPFFSPDGRWLGFTNGKKLMKVPVGGGAPLSLADAPYPTCGISWGENGTIVFAPGYGTGLVQIPESGGSSTTVINRAVRWPHFLPGGQAVLFTEYHRQIDDSRIMVHDLKTGKEKTLVKGGTDGRYIPTGHLVYAREGNLFAVPFDPKRLKVQDNPIPIIEGVMQSFEGVAQFSFSDRGSLAYVPGGFAGNDRILVWLERSGNEQLLGVPPRSYSFPHLSPDGKRIALTIQEANDDIWTYDIADRRFNRLTFQGRNMCPIWTPDGRRITFRSDQKGDFGNLLWMSADGSGTAEPLMEGQYFAPTPCAWSPDGKSLAFEMTLDQVQWHLHILSHDKERKPHQLLPAQADAVWLSFSPDGRWIAYQSMETGKTEIYVRPFPNPGGVWQVSTEGGMRPIWTRTGELLYVNGNRMMAVEIKTDPALKIGVPKPLFEKALVADAAQLGFDVTPDGEHILMIKSSKQEQGSTQIQFVLNWFEELKRLVPVEKK